MLSFDLYDAGNVPGGKLSSSQGKQMRLCISQMWVSSKSQRKLQVFEVQFLVFVFF